MKLSEFRNAYYTFSGKASDVARQLAFAGIALIWIFKEGGATLKIPGDLLLPAALLALALFSDLLQYSCSTLIWGATHRHYEKKLADKTKDEDFPASKYMNWPSLFFFWSKLILVCAAYLLICIYLWKIWF